MSAAVNSMIGAQSDLIGRGAGGSESGEESGTSESRALQRTRSVSGFIAVEVTAPEAVSSHIKWVVGGFWISSSASHPC